MNASPGPRRPAGAPGNARSGGSPAAGVPSARLTQAELAAVTASLRELAGRLGRFCDRLGALEAAVQSSRVATKRSSRDSRSSKRSRSS